MHSRAADASVSIAAKYYIHDACLFDVLHRLHPSNAGSSVDRVGGQPVHMIVVVKEKFVRH